MSPTEMVTLPAMTAPLSSTRFMRSESSSGVWSIASPGIVRPPREMVRRPGPRKLDAKAPALVIANERRDRRAKVVHPIVSNEERGVENRGSRLIRRRLRRRLLHRLERPRRQVRERGRGHGPSHATKLVLPRRLELARQQVPLPRRCGGCHVGFERRDRRAERTEHAAQLIIQPKDAHPVFTTTRDVCEQRRQ